MAATLSLLPRRSPTPVRVPRGVIYWLPHAPRDPWRTSFSATADATLSEILSAVDRGPRDVWVREDDPPLDDVDLMADLGNGLIAPIAVITAGLRANDARAALTTLAARA